MKIKAKNMEVILWLLREMITLLLKVKKGGKKDGNSENKTTERVA